MIKKEKAPNSSVSSMESEKQSVKEQALKAERQPNIFHGSRLEAEAWIEHNPKAWSWILACVESRVANNKRFSIHDLISALRWSDMALERDSMFKINDHLSPALARILIKEIPEAESLIEMRKSRCDKDFNNG